MRNIDRLRQMNTEELAAFLLTFGTCHVCAYGEKGNKSCFKAKTLSDIQDCEEGIKKYLEANVEIEEEEKESEFSERQLHYLEEIISDINSGKAKLVEHDLMEDDE